MAYNPTTGRYESGYAGSTGGYTRTTKPRSIGTKPTIIKAPSTVYKKPVSPYNPDGGLDQVSGTIPVLKPPTATKTTTTSTGSTYRDSSYDPATGGTGTGTGTGASTDAAAESRMTELEELRLARLAAALEAIGADFDLQEQTLQGQMTSMEDQFVRGVKANELLREQTVDTESNRAAERGIGRSGIFADRLATGLGQVADERSALVSAMASEGGLERLAGEGIDISGEDGAPEEGLQVRNLLSQIALLAQQEEAARSEAELESEQQQLTYEEMVALVAAGLR